MLRVKCFKSANSRSQTGMLSLIVFLLLAVFGIAYYSPMFLVEGIPHYAQEDTFFHLNRLLSMENVWESPVNFHSFERTGSLVNLFYPWLTMYPMWILYKICGSYVMAYKFYYLILSVVTVFCAYYAMAKMSNNRTSAICFSILYTYSSYRFADVFRRQALGESIAIAVLPIVLLGVYYTLFSCYKKWYVLCIGMSLIAYSHLLSVFMTSIMIGLILIIAIFFIDEKRERLIAMCKATGTTCLISAAAIIPVLLYYRDDTFRPKGSGELARDTAYSLLQILKNSLKNEPTAHGVGLIVVIAFALGLLLMAVPKEMGAVVKEEKSIKVFIVAGMAILIGTSSVLPWEYLGEHTILGNIQFVWRLNAYSTLLILAAFAWELKKIRRKDQTLFVICVCVIFAICLHYFAISSLLPEEEHRITESEIRTSLIVNHSPYFDYAPQTAFDYYVDNGFTLDKCYILGTNEKTDKIKVSDNGSELITEIEGDEKNRKVDIPVFYHDKMNISVKGEKVPVQMSERGTALIELVAEKEPAEVVVCYSYDVTIMICWAVSFMATLIMTAKVLKRKGEGRYE